MGDGAKAQMGGAGARTRGKAVGGIKGWGARSAGGFAEEDARLIFKRAVLEKGTGLPLEELKRLFGPAGDMGVFTGGK